MKRLKILLLFSFLVASLVYAFCFIKAEKTNSHYDLNTKNVNGVVHEVNDNKYKICNYECLIVYTDVVLNMGDQVEIVGKMVLPKVNTNFNLFNYRLYLYGNNIYYLFYADDVKVIGRDTFYRFKGSLIRYINNFKSSNYLNAFIMGDNHSLDDAVKDSYKINGISHLLSISGMHISLFAFFLLKVLKKFKYKNVIVNSFLIFYVILTGFKLSAVRSLFLFITSKRLKPINALIIVFGLFIIYNPYYLYNVGFQFSFCITFFLLLFKPKGDSYIEKIFITSLLSFIVSIPILASTNFEINLMSPILNIFFIPFISFIIFPFTILTFFIPFFDQFLFYLTHFLEEISFFLNSFNLTIILSKPSLWLIILYYVCILLTFYHFNYNKLIIIVFVISIHYFLPKFNPYAVITTLDVGQGDAMIIELEHQNKVVLVDTGGKVGSDYSISGNITIPYLKSHGINRIDYLILTHGDFDHMGEAINLVENFNVEKVIFNCGEFNELETELISVLKKKNIKYYSFIKELNIDNNKLYFLQTKEYDNENDNSNVIYTEIDGYKFMLMGDAGIEKEKDILDKYNISNVDVLKVGHHGSKTSSSEDFIKEMNPKYSVISVGKNNRYGHPNKVVLNNLDNSKIYRTDQDGSIMFKIKKDRLKIETCTP